MRQNPFFKLLCTLVLSVYGITTAQAAQVITPSDRQWAKEALARESQLGAMTNDNSVAVLNFHNKTSQSRLNVLQKGMALMLITDLAKIDRLYVIERIRVQALVDEMAFGETGLVTPQSAPKVGRLLRAYYVVNGDILENAVSEINLDSSLLNVPSEGITDLPQVVGGLDELSRMEKDVLFHIVDELQITISPKKRAELMQPLSTSTAALLALFAGIDLSDKEQYAEAAKMYDRALVEDPNLQAAQDALQELKDMGLIANEELSQIEPPESEVPPVEEGGMGTGTMIGIGLGAAALVGGAVLLLGDSGDSDSGGESQGAVTVTPIEVSAVDCYMDSVNFTFSEPMDQTYGNVSYNPAVSGIQDSWINSTTLKVEWHDVCSVGSSLTIRFRGFKSITGATLDSADCIVNF